MRKVLFMQKFKQWLAKGMQGRYGSDQLNLVILGLALALSLLGLIFHQSWLSALSFLPLALSVYRMFSRNTYRRHQENRRYLQILGRMKDRNNRYFKCPKCRQVVRVPRGKGKIAITCPRCHEKFVKST